MQDYRQLQGFIQSLGYKEVEVVEFPTAGDSTVTSPVEKKPKQPAAAKKEQEKPRETKIGLEVGKEEDFSLWYQQVLTRSEMLDYYDVSGCYILRPWSYNIWKAIQGGYLCFLLI